MKRLLVTGLAVLFLAGCSGGKKIVPVSGVVKLNGQPYPNAIVTFQPLGSEKEPNVGRGSSGKTDDNGHYTLVYDGEKPGALVGKHRVRICTDLGSGGAAKDERSESDPNWRPGRRIEPIPSEWHDLSTKEFEVPAKGTDQANFNIEVPQAAPKK
ncbi:MAG TPA: hypothetical protein VKE40_08830 [Gemmataceae bacterium]|nr:hypothetical protein [Gemmataceae bacterium]